MEILIWPNVGMVQHFWLLSGEVNAGADWGFRLLPSTALEGTGWFSVQREHSVPAHFTQLDVCNVRMSVYAILHPLILLWDPSLVCRELWGTIADWIGIGLLLFKKENLPPSPPTLYEKTAKGDCLQARKKALSRTWSCHHHLSELCSLQNCKKYYYSCKPLSLWYFF